jgi:hypothetical protein
MVASAGVYTIQLVQVNFVTQKVMKFGARPRGEKKNLSKLTCLV